MKRLLRVLDGLCAAVVFTGAFGHTFGSLATYPAGSEILVYALGVSVLAAVCGFLNFLRARRRDDRPVAWAALVTSVAYGAVAVGWGYAIGSPLDPRVIAFALSTAGLTLFSAAALLRR